MPVSASFTLGLREAIHNHEFPLGAASGGTGFLGCFVLLFHAVFLHLWVAGSMLVGMSWMTATEDRRYGIFPIDLSWGMRRSMTAAVAPMRAQNMSAMCWL